MLMTRGLCKAIKLFVCYGPLFFHSFDTIMGSSNCMNIQSFLQSKSQSTCTNISLLWEYTAQKIKYIHDTHRAEIQNKTWPAKGINTNGIETRKYQKQNKT